MIVVYNCDEYFASIFATSVVSLFENNKDVDNITVYLIEDEVSAESKSRFQDIAKEYKRNIVTIPMPKPDEMAKIEIYIPANLKMATCGRLFVSKLLPDDIDKIIYADCDTLFLSSISSLWDIDISDDYVGMVCIPTSKNHKRIIGISPNSVYYNSGLMLVNLKRWREEKVDLAFMEYIRKQNGFIPYPDEGVLNAVFEGKIRMLPLKYNVYGQIFSFDYKETLRLKKQNHFYSCDEYEEARRAPVMIHFITTYRIPLRPWINGCDHPYTNEYLRYRAKTPWKETPLFEDHRPPYKRAYQLFDRISRGLPSVLTDWMAEFFFAYIRPFKFYVEKQKHIRNLKKESHS